MCLIACECLCWPLQYQEPCETSQKLFEKTLGRGRPFYQGQHALGTSSYSDQHVLYRCNDFDEMASTNESKKSKNASKMIPGDLEMAPSWPKSGPRTPQRVPKMSKIAPGTMAWPQMTPGGAPGPILHVQDESKRLQDDSKVSSQRSQVAPKGCKMELHNIKHVSKMLSKMKKLWITILFKMLIFYWFFQ